MEKKYELIVCIVNKGFNEQVMVAAKGCGTKGGTVINARGTARQEAEKKFDILIHPEKEIVLILARNDIKDNILHAIYKEVGLDTPGQGIAFSTPVDDAIGLEAKKIKKEEPKEETNTEQQS